MPRKNTKKGNDAESAAKMERLRGEAFVSGHWLFAPLARRVRITEGDLPKDAWAYCDRVGYIRCNRLRRATSDEWAWVIAHALLHLAFRHHDRIPENSREWNAACCTTVDRFLKNLQIGRMPDKDYDSRLVDEASGKTEDKLYERFCREGLHPSINFGTAGNGLDLIGDGKYFQWVDIDWQELFAEGISSSVAHALNLIAGTTEKLDSTAQNARRWFINSYPLLGAMAAAFKVIEDPGICNREYVSIAAINAEMQEIYINPAAGLDEEQTKFVMAHEFLHVGLRHHLRCQGRDHYLWNVACDYVINGWLVEMSVGVPPPQMLLDETLKGKSAEEIYDIIVKDLRRYRKLATLRGNCGEGDMLGKRLPAWWDSKEGISLDEFYRRALAEGLAFHEASGRGLLPGNLVEEIRALAQPAVPWDVELAQWFDHHFPPIEKRRSYARPSRRQASTPDIPRPRYVNDVPSDARTFGVVIDTSGSMDRLLLGKALGAIASYSIARDVPFARVVFCDAAAYDQGYLAPEDISYRVQVRGRGGTVLQPGVDLIEEAKDFPDKGPILIITDAECDQVRVRRSHAFLIPAGAHLPFKVWGDVFRLK